VAAQSLELFAQGIAAGESTDGIVWLGGEMHGFWW